MTPSKIDAVAETERPLIGSWAAIPSAATAELAASVGYDFVVVDAEHTPIGYETMANILRGIDAGGAADAVVRVADDDRTTLNRTLDLGPDAILVPMVETADQARDIVSKTRYPPDGTRGVGIGRAAAYGGALDEQFEADDAAFGRHVQIESSQAVTNAAEIAAVEGIDGVFLGPADLSASLEEFAAWDAERFQDAVTTVAAAAEDADVAFGTLVVGRSELKRRADWGVEYLVAGVDLTHLNDGYADALDHARRVTSDG